ncbi:aldehyde ferredoxin oxidoreductase N-terminal domain-containing protein [Sediminispirochaeta bajacaliforniensis]|uniref:aldehyde ferredoxin oxidoreductase N-terminal domain-containing protein n=1 Tax=Sediminispirochaeta bajacaliforniensis TaxID=148 RepID=UPI0003603D25|nr:aldehyde ferredoxin oxidoreductase N-terminal domain-containing protein [Sediminispirochaeta bajacaliforniensis]
MNRGSIHTIRHIFLSDRRFEDEGLPEELFEHFLGGSGIAAELFSLFPSANLFIAPGLLTGSSLPFSGGWSVVMLAKKDGSRPMLLETFGQGSFGKSIASCGLDGLLFHGISPESTILHISPNKVRFFSTPLDSDLNDPIELEQRLLEDMAGKGKEGAVLCIGKAAREGDPAAALVHEGRTLPAGGGTGLFFGSLKLTAITIERGEQQRLPAEKEGFENLAETSEATIRELVTRKGVTAFMPTGARGLLLVRMAGYLPIRPRIDDRMLLPFVEGLGTVGLLAPALAAGLIPEGKEEGKMHRKEALLFRKMTTGGCKGCPFPCSGQLRIEGRYGEMSMPGYVDLAVPISLLGIRHTADALQFVEHARRRGMDPASAAKGLFHLIEEKSIRPGDIDAFLEFLDKPSEHHVPDHPNLFPFSFDPLAALTPHIDTIRDRNVPFTLAEYQIGTWWKQIKGLPRPAMLYHKKEDFWVEREKATIAIAVAQRNHLLVAAGICHQARLISEKHFPLFSLLNAFTGLERTPKGYLEMGNRIMERRKELFPLPPIKVEDERIAGLLSFVGEPVDKLLLT